MLKNDNLINILWIISLFSVAFALVVNINIPRDFLVTISYENRGKVSKVTQNETENFIINDDVFTDENYSSIEPEQKDSAVELIYEGDITQVEAAKTEIDFPLELNSITYEELLYIPSVGHVTATRIIQYRDYLGDYSNLEQLMEIKGIGEKSFEEISVYLYLE